MVLVIRVRPRQIERFVLISIILLLVVSNLYFFTQWVPKDKAAVALVAELPAGTQEAIAEGSSAEAGEGYEVLDLEELEGEVAAEEPTPEPVEEPEPVVEPEPTPEPVEEPVEEPAPEVSDDTVTTGNVKFTVDDLDWSIDGDKVRLKTIYYTIENGLDEELENPRFNVYIYDSADDDFLKNTAAGKFSLGKDVVSGDVFSYVIKAGEKVTSSIDVFDEVSKQNFLFTLDDPQLDKTVKVYLKDSGTDTEELETVQERAR